MVRLLKRAVQRLFVVALGILSVWFIVFVVFDFADQKLPWILALAVTYGIGAYVVFPAAFAWASKFFSARASRVIRLLAMGCPATRLILCLRADRTASCRLCNRWLVTADQLGLRSSWHMVRAFVSNSSYPTAPFSTLYLFGRGQDVGFQKAIDNSPRKRHHIRFWALSLAHPEFKLGTASFW